MGVPMEHEKPPDNRPPAAQRLTREGVTRPRNVRKLSRVSKSWPVEDFNRYLRALMDAAGIADYAELSRLSGVSQNQFSNWRRGLAQPSRPNLKKAAAALKVSPVKLYVRAGLDDEDDLELGAELDFTALPAPFHELRAVYERLNDLGRGAEALRSISLLVAGLKSEIVGLEGVETRRGDHTSGRRRSG